MENFALAAMAKKNRKRKLEAEEETETKWELSNILDAELREEMATMWEIPQIFHFLHMSKEALNISHLSMYEMERMLAMPRASKQLAMIMTALLGPPRPKGKIKTVPPMPYDFWVNVLTHKVKGWFKVYQSKHQDIVKVFEAIGVEPEFWKLFPEVSIIDENEFDQLSFKQRVWILKTLCDTLMHSRKTIQDEMAKQMVEDSCEVVLGCDRFGAKFIYFPLFLDNDLRVYRQCIDNTILSTVRPPPWTESQPSTRPEKNGRGKRKRSRWKNGSLPQYRKRTKRVQDDDVKMSGDSALGSSLNEDTNLSGASSCSNNNNIIAELEERNRSRSPSKASELGSNVSGDTRSSKKSSGYDTNTSTSDGKSFNEGESEEMFRGFDSEIKSKSSTDAIGNIHEILTRLTSNASETPSNENSMEDLNTEIESRRIDVNDDEDEEKKDEDALSLCETKFSDDPRPESRAESEDLNWIKSHSTRNKYTDPENFRKELTIFSTMLTDLSVSTFELAADSIDSLRDLANTLKIPDESRRTHVVPRCELTLAGALQKLAESLSPIEPKLRESTRKARTKLRKEFTNFRDGIIKDQDTSGDSDRGSNGWIIGSQGCPLLSSSETALQEVSDAPLSPAGTKSEGESEPKNSDEGDRDSAEPEVNEDGENDKEENCDKGEDGIKDENKESGENDDEQDSEPQTRRVLRARGVSSYTEQLSSSEEEAYELEEWSLLEAFNSAPGTSNGGSGISIVTKGGGIDHSGQKNSDKDWILPGARKRKHKTSPLSKRTKTSTPRVSFTTGNSQDSVSSVSPPMPQGSGEKSRTNDKGSTDNSFICKVESVHSELDIKDEGPIFESNRNTNQLGAQQNSSSSDQRQTVRVASNPRPVRPMGTVVPPRLMPQQMPPGYYVQQPQTYFDPRYMRYSYPPQARGSMAYPYQQAGHPPPPPPPPYPGQAQYWQPPNYPALPPGAFPAGIRGGYPAQRGVTQRQQGPSTTLYGARMPSQGPQNRMPAPRSTSTQNPMMRFPWRPRPPLNQAPPPRRYAPRSTLPQRNPTPRATRPNRPVPRPPGVKKPAVEKSTSLILLSDSDDEIEMIVPEKQSVRTPIAQTRKTPQTSDKTPTSTRPKSRPVVTSQITVSKSNELLSPQMIQRMSQGGISITPVKPPASKQKTPETAQGTKLVVVVNETGSHYALALPNGSKLILTPEQVAQIRASNGGKLVL
ncbi:uncharacterized protein [Venturia canescens]|uniref:uncharacterized protein isoform X2 n=1 Tax=Venturia canescens TaxID=32260 RepID=UPI001C9D5AA8|nr:uncharacterized protein LOC122405720 isoform X2 [Venturia canescens]